MIAAIVGAGPSNAFDVAGSAPAIWAIAGLLIAALELLAPGVFLLWVGLGALGTAALTAAFALSPAWQFGSFVAVTAALIGGVAVRLRRRPGADVVNAPAAGLIGRTCIAMGFRGTEGRVSLGDGVWPARTTDASAPCTGEALQVVGLDGTTLLVIKPA